MKNLIRFSNKEEACEAAFRNLGQIWHLCTPGEETPVIFRNDDDFRCGMNLLAVTKVRFPDIPILAFALMSNHVHFVVCGSEERVSDFFDDYRKRIIRFVNSRGYEVDLSMFHPELKLIDSLEYLRNVIVYVSRNGYVSNSCYTPFSYPWSSGRQLFNGIPDAGSVKELSFVEKREMFRCRVLPELDSRGLLDGCVSPASLCSLNTTESMFRDAHHYFFMVTKNVESYGKIAEQLGDGCAMTLEEMMGDLKKIAIRKYQTYKIASLGRPEKIELARKMHYDYHASNAQIRMVFGFSKYEVDELFPLSAAHKSLLGE